MEEGGKPKHICLCWFSLSVLPCCGVVWGGGDAVTSYLCRPTPPGSTFCVGHRTHQQHHISLLRDYRQSKPPTDCCPSAWGWIAIQNRAKGLTFRVQFSFAPNDPVLQMKRSIHPLSSSLLRLQPHLGCPTLTGLSV